MTLQKDIQKVKELLKEDSKISKKKIRKMSALYLPKYNIKILAGLNQWEKDKWMDMNYD